MRRYSLILIIFITVLSFFFIENILSGDLPEQNIIARLKYDGGGDWYSNPTSLPNLAGFINRETNLRINTNIETVTLDDNKIFSFPVVYMTGHGNVRFSDDQVMLMRKYLTNGGFLFADDNYGMDTSFRKQIKKVFPSMSDPFKALPFDHGIYHIYYDFPKGLPKIHEHAGGPPAGYGVFYNGRLVAFYSFNTDLGDGWENPEIHNDPEHLRLAALKTAVNVILYAIMN